MGKALELDRSGQAIYKSELGTLITGTLHTKRLLHQLMRSKAQRRLLFAGAGHADLIAAKLGIPVYRRLPEGLADHTELARRFKTHYDTIKENSPELRELSRIIKEETGIKVSRLSIVELHYRNTGENADELRILEIIRREAPRLERKNEERQAKRASE